MKYLYHHGIPGQKWGVRRGPPYPIEDRVLPKGYKLNSVRKGRRTNIFEPGSKRWLYTYRKDDPWDNKVYKGPFARFLLMTAKRGQNYVYEHQYEVIKDLKMPTKEERIDGFIDTFLGNRERTVADLKVVQRLMREQNVGSAESKNLDLDKFLLRDSEISAKEVKTAYEIFNLAMEFADHFASTSVYKSLMTDKYDAMVDDNNVNIYNRAHDPIIIFKANEALKQIGSVKMVTIQQINQNYEAVKKELEKSGERVKL